jgi:Tfp pilus assembly protein PilO
VVVAILIVDLVLLGYRTFRRAPGAETQHQEELQMQAAQVLLAKDVHRVAAIRDHLPEVRRQCDDFFSKELRPASSGYSGIVADLNSIAHEAGLRTGDLRFTQREVGNRGITEIEMSGTVTGAYPNLVSFINGLERSGSFYVLESLELASSTGSELRMNVRLKTYFRT